MYCLWENARYAFELSAIWYEVIGVFPLYVKEMNERLESMAEEIMGLKYVASCMEIWNCKLILSLFAKIYFGVVSHSLFSTWEWECTWGNATTENNP